MNSEDHKVHVFKLTNIQTFCFPKCFKDIFLVQAQYEQQQNRFLNLSNKTVITLHFLSTD